MNKLRLDKREVTLNEKDSCLDMLVFTESLCSAYATFGEAMERKQSKRTLAEGELALRKECELWEKALQKPIRI